MFPTYVPTRTVSLSAGYLDPGINAAVTLSVTVRSSLDLTWIATGFTFAQMVSTYTASPPALWQITLPTTDATGWKNTATGAAVSSPTHSYTATIEFVSPLGGQTVPAVTIGPFSLPIGDGSVVSLDSLFPITTVTGTIPDVWGSISQARATIAAVTDASLLTSGTLNDARLPVASQGASVINASNLTTGTVADARLPAYVAKGALVRNIVDYGAVGDGTTDNTTAFNAAIAYANSLLGSDRENVTGVTFHIPDGRYKISSALNPITVSGVHFTGRSRDGSVLLLASASTTFTWGDSSLTRLPVGGGLHNMKIEYAADTVGSVVTIDYAFDTEFSDLQLVRIPTLLKMGITSSRIAGGVTVRNVHGSIANAGVPLFDLRFGAGFMMSDSGVFVRGVLPPVHPAAMTTVTGTYAFSCLAGSWDTIQISNSIFERFDFGMIVIPAASQIYQNFMLSNTVFDYCKRQGIYLDSTNGIISGFSAGNRCWVMSWEDNSVQILGSSMNDFHDMDLIIPISGKGALSYAATNAKQNRYKLAVGANSRASALAGSVYFAPGAKGFHLDSCDGNDDLTAAGTPWRNDWGVYVGADCDGYRITDCRFTGGAGGGYNLAANTVTSTNRRINGNIGTGYAGYVALSPAGSTVVTTNLSALVWDLSIYGGTVTVIAKNGTTITGMTSGSLRIGPGETFAITYSVAPSISRFVQA
jgi:hypothetical protein